MGRYTQKIKDTLDEIALRKYVRALPREDYLAFIDENPGFRSSDAQLHSDLDLLTMKAVSEELGKEAGIAWAHRRYWSRVGQLWRAERAAEAMSGVQVLGLSLVFNGAKYGALMAVAYLALPLGAFAGVATVLTVIVFALALLGAALRRVI